MIQSMLVVPATFILVSNHVLFKEAKNKPEPSWEIFELFLTMILWHVVPIILIFLGSLE